eukprot:2480329-Amphidinium_carterae.1
MSAFVSIDCPLSAVFHCKGCAWQHGQSNGGPCSLSCTRSIRDLRGARGLEVTLSVQDDPKPSWIVNKFKSAKSQTTQSI